MHFCRDLSPEEAAEERTGQGGNYPGARHTNSRANLRPNSVRMPDPSVPNPAHRPPAHSSAAGVTQSPCTNVSSVPCSLLHPQALAKPSQVLPFHPPAWSLAAFFTHLPASSPAPAILYSATSQGILDTSGCAILALETFSITGYVWHTSTKSSL